MLNLMWKIFDLPVRAVKLVLSSQPCQTTGIVNISINKLFEIESNRQNFKVNTNF